MFWVFSFEKDDDVNDDIENKNDLLVYMLIYAIITQVCVLLDSSYKTTTLKRNIISFNIPSFKQTRMIQN